MLKCQIIVTGWLMNSKEIEVCHQISTKDLNFLLNTRCTVASHFHPHPLFMERKLEAT